MFARKPFSPSSVAVTLLVCLTCWTGAAATAQKQTPPAKARPQSTGDEKNIVGRWIDPLPSGFGLAIIKRTGNGYVLLAEPTYTKPYSFALRRRGKSRFEYIDSADRDYVIIGADGRLLLGDKEGLVRKLDPAPTGAGDKAKRTAAVVSAQEVTNCQHDLDCTIGSQLNQAKAACRSAIERRSKWDFRWTATLGVFDGYRWNPKHSSTRGRVDFLGDSVEFQNGFGAWINYSYICTYDARNGIIVGVEMRPGHLSK